ncbi:MAG TPA: hypothetical protein PJ988_10580 [Anaerolinea sp.]|nr:hypothetical protein [Anaerolinea sp.]
MPYNYKMPDGRPVGLKRLIIRDTYADFLEGTREIASRYIREELPEMAARLLPPGQPLCFVDLGQAELPPWMCLAELDSPDGAKGNGQDTNSRLFVCWFMDNTAMSLDAMIWVVLKGIDWERYAEDYDLDW